MEADGPKPPLDPLVKTALTLCLGLILITVIGMILTAPDRSIPPYSIMVQQGEIVLVSVPPRTTDPEIEALLVRFRAARQESREGFARLKIKPTTPRDPQGRYQVVTIYVLANPSLADDASLTEYLAGSDPQATRTFERAVRGIYRLTPDTELGALGWVADDATLGTGSRVLFQEQRAP